MIYILFLAFFLLYPDPSKEHQLKHNQIYLYYFQGFKYKEICKILNQSMPKTKMAIHRAKKLLEKFVKEDNNYDEG